VVGSSVIDDANYALMKGLLFLCAGAFHLQGRNKKIKQLAGIGHKMPLTAIAFTIAALAISGLPSLNGFISELMIVYAGIRSNMPVYTAILLNILLGFAYYLRLIKIVVWSTPNERLDKSEGCAAPDAGPHFSADHNIIGVYPAPFIEIAGRAVEVLTTVF